MGARRRAAHGLPSPARATPSWRGWGAALRGLSVALAAGSSLADALDRGGDAARTIVVGGAAAALPAAAAVARVGGDPVDDLGRRIPPGPGSRLVAALSLSTVAGVAPAQLADRVASSVQADERAGRAAAVALSGARATTRLLAALPVAGIGLAASFGASAPAFLLSSPVGHGCLLVAAVLEVAGLRWSARIMAGTRR